MDEYMFKDKNLRKLQIKNLTQPTHKPSSPNAISRNLSPSLDFLNQSNQRIDEISNPKLFMKLVTDKLKALGKLMQKLTTHGIFLQEIVSKSNPEYRNVLATFRTDTEEIERTIEDIVTPRFRCDASEIPQRSVTLTLPDKQNLNEINSKERQAAELKTEEIIALDQNKIKNLEIEIINLKAINEKFKAAQEQDYKNILKSTANIENLNSKIKISNENLKKAEDQNTKLMLESQNLNKQLIEKIEYSSNLEKQLINSMKIINKDRNTQNIMRGLRRKIRDLEDSTYEFQIQSEKKMKDITILLDRRLENISFLKDKIKKLHSYFKERMNEAQTKIIKLSTAISEKDANMCTIFTAIGELEEIIEQKNIQISELEFEKNTLLSSRDKLIIQCNKQSEEIIILKTALSKDEDFTIKGEKNNLSMSRYFKSEENFEKSLDDRMNDLNMSEDIRQIRSTYKTQIAFFDEQCKKFEKQEKELQEIFCKERTSLNKQLDSYAKKLVGSNALIEKLRQELENAKHEDQQDLTEYIPLKVVSFENKIWYLIKHKQNDKFLWTDKDIKNDLRDEYQDLMLACKSLEIVNAKLSEEVNKCRITLSLILQFSKKEDIQEILKILIGEKVDENKSSGPSPIISPRDGIVEQFLDELKSVRAHVEEYESDTFSDLTSKVIRDGVSIFNASSYEESAVNQEELTKLSIELEKATKELNSKQELIRQYEEKIIELKEKQNCNIQSLEKLEYTKSTIEKYLLNSVPFNQNVSALIETLCCILEIPKAVPKISINSKK